MTSLLIGAPILHRDWIVTHWAAAAAASAALDALPEPADFGFVAVGDRARDPLSFAALESAAGPRLIDTIDHPEPDLADQCDCDNRPGGPAADHDDRADPRHWCRQRFDHMAAVRNRLLARVRELAPDLFLSVDTDILLDPWAITRMRQLLERGGYAAVGSRTYLHPKGTRDPNYALLAGGLSRPDTRSEFRCDVLMAIKLMTPAAYQVDYAGDRRGEDFGWSANARAAGLTLGWTGQVTSKHAMRESQLATVDARVGW